MTQMTGTGAELLCPSCGGHIIFDAEAQQFRCASCGAVQKITPKKEQVEEYDFADYRLREKNHMLEGGELTLTCGHCGAEIFLLENETATVCPMCGKPALRPAGQDTGIPVEGIVPFAIDRFEAQKRFGAWIRKRWFAPNSLKRLFSEGQLQGVYVPFWTYDVEASAKYTGRGGITRTRTNSKGETQTYTDWYPVSGEVYGRYDDLQVCASRTFQHGLIERVLPYDSIRNTRPYQPQYLSGYRAERYTVSGVEGFEEARQSVERDLSSRATAEIRGQGYDQAQITSFHPRCHHVRYKHILVPLWNARYGYCGKTYRYMINGETGKVSAEYPKSPAKIALVVLAVLLIMGLLLYFMGFFEPDLSPDYSYYGGCVMQRLDEERTFEPEYSAPVSGTDPGGQKPPGGRERPDGGEHPTAGRAF